jgi:hypothetical protein
MDTICYERSDGRWQAWTHTEDGKYYFRTLDTIAKIEHYAREHGYNLVAVE